MTTIYYSEDDDSCLLALLGKGDNGAFNTIFRKYYHLLCSYAYQYLAGADVEEVVQDIMVWLWENRNGLSIHGPLKSYLYKAVYLRCLSRIDQRTSQRRREQLYGEQYVADIEEDVPFQSDELIAFVKQSIDKLPEKYGEAFVLHRFRNQSYKEIAAQLNVSAKTIDYRIQQALKLLRADLKTYVAQS